MGASDGERTKVPAGLDCVDEAVDDRVGSGGTAPDADGVGGSSTMAGGRGGTAGRGGSVRTCSGDLLYEPPSPSSSLPDEL